MSKIIEYGKDARQKVYNGVEKLARAVAVTMGPMGKNVIVGRSVGAPTITKDGVSVAREVVLSDPTEELGCQLVKEAAGRTCDIVGDGTTTATVLAHEIFKQGKHLSDSGYSPLCLKYGIEWALEQVLLNLETITQPVDSFEKIKAVATISANNDVELGTLIAEAYQIAGSQGMVTAEARPGVDSFIRTIDGLEIRSGYISSEFLDSGKSSVELENCRILICNQEISNHFDNIELFKALDEKKQSLLIICKDLTKVARQFFLINNTSGLMKSCAIKIPAFGLDQNQWLDDLALLTGTVVVDDERGMTFQNITIDKLGFAKKIEVNKYLTKITAPHRNEVLIADKVNIYKNDRDVLVSESIRRDIDNRIAFLSSKSTIITVGYSTELELREKGDRVEDSMFAVRAAMDGGFVPGGGFALLWSSEKIDLMQIDEKYHDGAKVIINACRRPAKQIMENAGLDSEEILKNTSSQQIYFNSESLPNLGYNTATGEFGDLIKMGVIDPKKVTKTALQNATTIALLLINTEASIAEDPSDPSSWQAKSGWRLPADKGFDHKH